MSFFKFVFFAVVVFLLNAHDVSAATLCPTIARTQYKEEREIDYTPCTSECFHEIRLHQITLAGQFNFLYAAGCVDSPTAEEALAAHNLTRANFTNLCINQEIQRCIHRYPSKIYGGTLCCERDEEEVLKSWLWDIFFGKTRELEFELKATERFMENDSKGKKRKERSGTILVVVVALFVLIVFTLLSLLQFYHINDGVLN